MGLIYSLFVLLVYYGLLSHVPCTTEVAYAEQYVKSLHEDEIDAKVINVLAVLSFVGTAGIIGGGTLFIFVVMQSLKVSKSKLLNSNRSNCRSTSWYA